MSTDPRTADVRVRPARPSDLRHLQAVEASGAALYADHLGDAVVPALLTTPPRGADRDEVPGFLLVAQAGAGADGEVVGFAHVTTYAAQDDVAHLEQLSLVPAWGRHGVGARLVEAAAEEARWAGYAELALCTYRDLPWNGPFYARLGFAEVSAPTAYQRDLRAHEQALGLDEAGPRMVMARPLGRRPSPAGAHVTGE